MTRKTEPQDLLTFLVTHKREPSLTGYLPDEPKIARWLLNQRSYFRRTGKVNPGYEAFLGSNGFPGILRRNRRESKSSQMARMLCAWVTERGTEPRADSKVPGESYLGEYLDRKRSKGTCSKLDLRIAAEAGLPNIFDPRDREDLSSLAAMNFGLWVQEHDGAVPSRRSRDAKERSLANWYWNKRSILLGNLSGTVYGDDCKILESFGLGHLMQG